MPRRALVLSVAALAAPLAANILLPEWLSREGALLAWLPAVLPAFLLAYYRGWNGASLALAAAMATLAVSQVELLILDVPPPPWEILLTVVGILLSVTLGAGWMAERLHTERSEAERAAFEDPLTGLPNRRYATMALDAAWTRIGPGGKLAVALFDLDRFKEVNRSRGHLEGDRALTAFGRILAERTGPNDLSARWGGEEFMTILEGHSMEEAAAFAEAVREELAAIRFPWGAMTASAGVSAVEQGMGAPDVLLAAADRALHQAKELGRDRVRRADQPLVGSAGAPTGRTGDVRSAADGKRLGSLQGLRVLLVDDDEAVLRTTSRLLERLGCVVSALASPAEAIRALTQGEPPQVIVTDIIMPEMSGFTLVDVAARVVHDLPALYISGYPQEEVYWGGSPGSRSAFLSKPLEMARLEETLHELLGVSSALTAGAPALDRTDARKPRRHPRRATAAGDGPRRLPLEGRILVLDDEIRVVQALQRLFARTGYPEPIGLTDPLRLPDVLAREEVDLLILDLNMPERGGFDVLAELPGLLEEGEYLPVLVLTGDDDPELRRKALAAGAHEFLQKPFDVAEAQARVKNLLETRLLNQRVAHQLDEMEDRVRERTAELADTRTEILHRLARAAEYRDDITGRHAERVGLLASLLAGELGFPHREVDIIRRTAPLHDVGKIGVPDAILRKPGKLTPSEFELMKTHTLIGEEILGGGRHKILKTAAEIALSHHEHWDGKGYPHGLAGSDIPISARLVSVADTFDTLTHNRPYKDAHPVPEVIAEIRRCRGTQFDPAVVDAFNALCQRVGPERFTQLSDPLDPRRDIYFVHER